MRAVELGEVSVWDSLVMASTYPQNQDKIE